MNEKMILPKNIKKAIDMLNAGGFSAYAVGGCIRDSLMGVVPHDYDITTSAFPDDMRKIFADFHTVDTGIKHGTITVMMDKEPVEITTFRTDGEYSDHRHPDCVKFTRSLEEDLKRRDFTINAMAYNDSQGLVDLFGGISDIESKTIKCVGNPTKRFHEDALRILRALRFSAVLGFDIDDDSSAAMVNMCRNLKYVSVERIASEFSRLICGKSAAAIIENYMEIIFQFIPELEPLVHCVQNSKYHRYDVWFHTLNAFRNTEPDLEIRMAVLLHDIGKPAVKSTDEKGFDHFYGHAAKSVEIAENILTRMKFDGKTKQHILWLIKHHDEVLPFSETRVKRLLNSGTNELFIKLTKVMYADNSAKAKDVTEQRKNCADDAMKIYEKIISQGACVSLKSLKINGNDLIAMGFEVGEDIGKTLGRLLDLVLDNRIANEADVLKDTALKLKAQAMYPKDRS